MKTAPHLFEKPKETANRSFFNGKNEHSRFFNPTIQAKLAVNESGDTYEQEADAVADNVMRMPTPSVDVGFGMSDIGASVPKSEMANPKSNTIPFSQISRKCDACESEEEEEIQRKDSSVGGGKTAPPIVHDVIASSGKALDSNTRQFMESRMGHDFSHVQVHTDSKAAESAAAVKALAYTSGNHIVFNNGQYTPDTEGGKKLLAHELVHTLQQNSGSQKIQKKDEDCSNYEQGEIDDSHSESGILGNDIILEPGRIIIADFGVDWRHVKNIAKTSPTLQSWFQIFESNPSYSLKIVGYSDCVGSENNNTHLRQGRAKRVEDLLPAGAKSRVGFRGMAALGDYIGNNTTKEERAKNRGVVIEFSQSFDFEPEEIAVEPPKYCGPDSTEWLIDEMNENRKDSFIAKCGDFSSSNERFIPGWNVGAVAACLDGFKSLVQAGAIWDFKSNQPQWRHRAKRHCPATDCDKTVTLCGHCLFYDVPGNIHFGYIGRMAGIRPWVLHKGADRAQKGGVDDPKDTVAINIGINMADNGATLCEEINDKISELNQDSTTNCSPCQWSNYSSKNRIQ